MAERLRSAYIDLNDLSSDADSQKEDVEFNPERMVFVEERLNLIYTLQQKHHLNSVAELIALQEKYTAQLQEIDSYDNQIRSTSAAGGCNIQRADAASLGVKRAT